MFIYDIGRNRETERERGGEKERERDGERKERDTQREREREREREFLEKTALLTLVQDAFCLNAKEFLSVVAVRI